jgi:hypothetical protein
MFTHPERLDWNIDWA